MQLEKEAVTSQPGQASRGWEARQTHLADPGLESDPGVTRSEVAADTEQGGRVREATCWCKGKN